MLPAALAPARDPVPSPAAGSPVRRGRRSRAALLARYAGASVVSTLVGMTVLGALVATGALTPGWANLAATGAGTLPSFELNRRWVWRRQGARSVRAELVPFAALSLLGLVASTTLVSSVGHLAAAATPAIRTLAVEAADVAGFGSVWVLQFVVLDRLLFRERSPG